MYNDITKLLLEKFRSLWDKTALVYVLVFAINFIIKILLINAQPLSGDEPFSLYISQLDVPNITSQLFLGNNPPLYEIILHYWTSWFGIDVFSVRLLSVLISSLTAVIIFRIARSFFNSQIAIVSGLLFLFSSYQLTFSHEARCYSLLALLTCVSFYCFTTLINQKHRTSTIVYYILVNAAMMYLHYFAAWVLFSQGIIALASYKIYHKKINIIIYANCAVLLLLAPLGYIIFHKITGNDHWSSSWVPTVKSLDPLYDMIWTFSNMPVNAVFCLVVFGIYITILLQRKVKVSFEGFVVLGWFWIIYLSMFVVSFKIPMFFNRYLMPAGIAFPLFIAYILNKVSQIRYLKYIYIILPFLFIGTAKFNAKPNIEANKMVDLVKQENRQDSTLVLIQPHWALLNFIYYYDRNIFKQTDNEDIYKHINLGLNAQNIYGVNQSTDSVFLSLSNYYKIVFLDTDRGTVFPGNGIQNLLSKDYKLISHNPDTLGCGYYIYSKPTNGPR